MSFLMGLFTDERVWRVAALIFNGIFVLKISTLKSRGKPHPPNTVKKPEY